MPTRYQLSTKPHIKFTPTNLFLKPDRNYICYDNYYTGHGKTPKTAYIAYAIRKNKIQSAHTYLSLRELEQANKGYK